MKQETNNPKQETRNKKQETLNQKHRTRNTELETQNTKHKTRNSKHEKRNTKNETRKTMIKFLIHRPIAVIMTYIAILVLGLVASGLLPVSLMPDIDIPEITVQVNRPGASAREIDEGIVAPLRYQLMQVPHLDKLSTESRNGNAILKLRFNYGTDINYAFIDVNEKVDAAMDNLPDDMDRPAIVKASASDLPVFYVNVWQENIDEVRFMELSELTRSVLIKR
ncbi:MAG: hypothetical protein PWQ06_792, partial [Anaerophaga sp.]|nr:hypothetical protein [Anaerophaga sp.]